VPRHTWSGWFAGGPSVRRVWRLFDMRTTRL